ncbi:MAG: Na+/H+ antiporter subunit E [Fimbriimonadaceae bacterium]
MLLWNIVLAFVWAGLRGDFSPSNLGGGFVLGFALLWLLDRQGVIHAESYIRRAPRLLGLIGFFFAELILANLRLAWEVVQPRPKFSPGIIAVPLEAKTDAEITILAILISLTPGTVSINVSPDRRFLYVHMLNIPEADPEKAKAEIKNGFERRILAVMR